LLRAQPPFIVKVRVKAPRLITTTSVTGSGTFADVESS